MANVNKRKRDHVPVRAMVSFLLTRRGRWLMLLLGAIGMVGFIFLHPQTSPPVPSGFDALSCDAAKIRPAPVARSLLQTNGFQDHKLLEKATPEKGGPEREREEAQAIADYTRGLTNSTEVSVVTAYFNLGSLNKSAGQEGAYTPMLYKKWMSTFAWLDNPLVVFVDAEDTERHFRQLRARYPPNRTRIIRVARQELWAFQLEPEIRGVFCQPGYPRHAPNTLNPLYSCAMHAKFELVQRVIRQHAHPTRYVAWLDIGLFRAEADETRRIHLTVPRDLQPSKVGYSLVNEFQALSPLEIVRQNAVWVGGASFVAEAGVLDAFCSQYRRAVRALLDRRVMSTDQQVIYSMFQRSLYFKPTVQLQTYSPARGAGDWFYLGYVMSGNTQRRSGGASNSIFNWISAGLHSLLHRRKKL